MKGNALGANVVLYNVCIDCFGKVGKMDMAWKFFHEMKAQNIMPDDVTYTTMIDILCKENKLDETTEMLRKCNSSERFHVFMRISH